MSDIKEAIAILKARWPDVVLITGLGVLCMFVNRMFLRLGEKDSLLQTMNLLCMLAYLVVMFFLMVAFERAVYLQGGKWRSPIDLLRVGRPFFWRAIRFGLLYVPVYFILASIVFSIIRRPMGIEGGLGQAAKVARSVYYLCYGVSALILIKPSLLVTPIIVVRDCRVLMSLKLLRQCRLSDAGGLVQLFLAATAMSLLWSFLPSPEAAATLLQHILGILLFVTQNILGLTTTVMAVRFVGSLDLAHHNGSGPPPPPAPSD